MTTASYSDTGVSANGYYRYQVRAKIGSTYSTYAGTKSAVTTVLSAPFTSIATEDGYVDSTGVTSTNTLLAGEDLNSNRMVGILSFNTSGLPDGAVVDQVTLRLKQLAIEGSPFDFIADGLPAGLKVGVKSGIFGSAATLEAADLSSAATASTGSLTAEYGVNNAYWDLVLTGTETAINKTTANGGRTQVRVDFSVSTSSATNQFFAWYDGTNAQLLVEYH